MPELEFTALIATVEGHDIAVIATFARFEYEVSAPGIHAEVGISDRIAQLAGWTIGVLVARADVARGITESALANARRQTRVSELDEARHAASVARRRIAVVATFASFDEEIAAAWIHADIRVWPGST